MASIIFSIHRSLPPIGGFSSDNSLTTVRLSNGWLIRLLDLLLIAEQDALCGLIFFPSCPFLRAFTF